MSVNKCMLHADTGWYDDKKWENVDNSSVLLITMETEYEHDMKARWTLCEMFVLIVWLFAFILIKKWHLLIWNKFTEKHTLYSSILVFKTVIN